MLKEWNEQTTLLKSCGKLLESILMAHVRPGNALCPRSSSAICFVFLSVVAMSHPTTLQALRWPVANSLTILQ